MTTNWKLLYKELHAAYIEASEEIEELKGEVRTLKLTIATWNRQATGVPAK